MKIKQDPYKAKGMHQIFHLIMTLVTLGGWIPIWIVCAIGARILRPKTYTVEES